MFDHIKPVQDSYDPNIAICYGCGFNNPHGLHVKTRWDGEVGHSSFTPRPEHTAFPNFVYGGLIASIIDCHSMGTAIAALHDAEGREMSPDTDISCVTGNLNVSYKKPTPIGVELKLESRIKEMTERKVIVTTELFANGEVCVVSEVIAVRVSSRIIKGD